VADRLTIPGSVLFMALTVNAQTLTTLHSFQAGNDGAAPNGGVAFITKDIVLGTTAGGGTSRAGTIFAVRPVKHGRFKETVLYTFLGGDDGANPTAGLTHGANGVLYGVCVNGGASNRGTVFQFSPPSLTGGHWTESVIYSFGGGSDGAHPWAPLVRDSSGVLYGTTIVGGSGNGTVFLLAPPAVAGGSWTETVLYSFKGNGDGTQPYAGLTLGKNGVLYGATIGGGSSGNGTVFQLTPPAIAGGAWTETVLYSFTGGSDGAHPYATLLPGGLGDLYGTTSNGGASSVGTAFQLKPATTGPWTLTVLHTFAGGTTDGEAPSSGLAFGPHDLLFGTTAAGGTSGAGIVYRLNLPPNATAWNETILYNFTGADGAVPLSRLEYATTGLLYGTAEKGGRDGHGTVFALKP
jgi:uncharacterized repeat protein (TIGR03803 family)